MINYTVIKACHNSHCVFIHEGLHVGLHLYLNVFIGRMFLSTRLRLAGGMGSRDQAADVVVCGDC